MKKAAQLSCLSFGRQVSLFIIFYFLFALVSCSVNKQITKQANKILLNDTAIRHGHIGISIYEPASQKYWYEHDAEKYFVPASNTKLFTLYAGMKYLGDSLAGLRYEMPGKDYTAILGTGDPTFLHPDFKNQPVFDFLKNTVNPSYILDGAHPVFSPLGKGWAWDDYQSEYAAERSEMPIYGNVVKFYMQSDTIAVSPRFFYSYSFQWLNTTLRNGVGIKFKIVRPFDENSFHAVYPSSSNFSSQLVPFKTISNPAFPNQNPTFIKLLEDTLHKNLGEVNSLDSKFIPGNIIHSQPTDSLFKPMMHRSDNFFAEQTLLMASNEHLGYMSDQRMIDTLLKTDLKDLPQQPKWVDGSGLSRYNLFTPQDFVFLLQKLKTEFGWERIKNILPTGGEGTLSGYYKTDEGFIYAKTGTLSNNCALSGYLITKKGKTLIFSILVNNYMTGAAPVRKAVEQFLIQIRKKY